MAYYQLVRDNEVSAMFARVYEEAKKINLGVPLNGATTAIIGSPALGYALFDSDPFYASFGIEREFFAANYEAIVYAMQNAGTLDAYITIVKSALGAQTTIEFEQINDSSNPHHQDTPVAGTLNCKITQQVDEVGIKQAPQIGDERGQLVKCPDWVERGLKAKTPTNERTIAQVRLVLELLVPADIYATFEVL